MPCYASSVELPPEDLSREIDRLWAKVSSASAEMPEVFAPPPAQGTSGAEAVAWETVALLKRQQQDESRYWAELLEARERSLRALREREAALVRETAALRAALEAGQERLLSEGLEAQHKVQAAAQALQEERRRHEEEEGALKALLEQTRERLASETMRQRREREEWQKRQEQLLKDVQDLQAAAERYQEESQRAGGETQRLSQSLREAKNALEKTLAELLRERQIRAQADQERENALKKVDEVQKRFTELSRLWEEERAQWRELWDRERSSWETQRTEIAQWESKLRQEREAWHAEMKAKEESQAQHAAQMSRSLRESAELSTKMAALLKTASGKPPLPARPWLSARAKRAFLAGVLVFVAAASAWRYCSRYHFKAEVAHATAFFNPTALAYDGSLLWVAEWDGRVSAVDPADPKILVRQARVSGQGAYRPVSLAFGGEALWSVDAAQARILRHKAGDPARVLAVRASPGPAPTAIAFDGRALWSYDSVNKSFYRHGADEGSFKAFPADPQLVCSAMAWVAGELWVYDARGKSLVVYSFAEETLAWRASYPWSEAALALASAQGPLGTGPRRLWMLAGPGPSRAGYAIVPYAY